MLKIKFFHPYIPAMVNRVEQWLTRQAENGLILYDVKHWNFTFLKAKESHKEYFIYLSLDKNKGITSDIFIAKDLYGKSKSKSNVNKKLFCNVFEVDIEKKDAGLIKFYMLRNKYYKKFYFKILLLTLIFSIFFFLSAIFINKVFFVYLFPCLVMFFYYFISFVIISLDTRHFRIKNNL